MTLDIGFQNTVKAQKTVLIVEDEHVLATLLKDYFEQAGYSVIQMFFGTHAIEYVERHQPDMVILDLGLPDVDGLEICNLLRAKFSGPIMVLTADDQENTQLTAFKQGVDDFQIKPVSPAILAARVQALMTRYSQIDTQSKAKSKVVGNLMIDERAHRCLVDEQVLKLSSFEFKLLNLLMDNVGHVLSRDQIYQALLKREYNGTERTVDVRMAKLREKLSQVGLRSAEIETVWGQGYVFNEIAC